MKVKIIAHTENPDLVVATAAKLCYAGCDIDELLEKQTPESIQKFITMLEEMGHCYDEDTEVLTNHGFVKWNDAKIKQLKLAAIDPKTRAFKGFETPSNFIEKDIDANMIRYNDKNIDLFITDKHKIYCSLSNTQQSRINPSFSLIEADKVYNKPMRMVKSAININNKIDKNDILYSLYGFFIGDGYADVNSKNEIKFHLKLTRKIEYLRNLCNELNYILLEQKNNSFVVKHENIAKDFRKMFYNKNKEKTFPDSFFNMSSNQFNYFIDGLKNSDGSIKRNTWCYSSTSEELVNKIQALGSINNTVFTIQKKQRNVFKMNVNNKILMPHLNDARKKIYAHKEKYKGKVYCATVSTGLLVVRRNNIVSLCGNCSPTEHVSFTFAIEGVSRVTEQQLTRHRIASYSIQSGRYVNRSNASFYESKALKECETAHDIYISQIEQSKKAYENITNALIFHSIISYHTENEIDIPNFSETKIIEDFKENHKSIYKSFEKKAIENARLVFPNSLETKIICTMNARTLFNFFNHRCCFRAQEEIRNLANEMLKLVKELSPNLFRFAGASCKTGICPEGKMQCEQLKGKIPNNIEVKKLIKQYYTEDWRKNNPI